MTPQVWGSLRLAQIKWYKVHVLINRTKHDKVIVACNSRVVGKEFRILTGASQEAMQGMKAKFTSSNNIYSRTSQQRPGWVLII